MTIAQAINSLVLIGLIGIAVCLLIIGHKMRWQALIYGAVGFWIIAAVIAYGIAAGAWGAYYGIFFFCVGMSIVSVLDTLVARPKTEEDRKEEIKKAVLEEEDDEGISEDVEYWQRRREVEEKKKGAYRGAMGFNKKRRSRRSPYGLRR